VDVVVIANPAAGGGRGARVGERVVSALAARGVDAALAPTAGPGDATRLAAAAVAGGARTVAACGGDGTVHEVVAALAGGTAALGIVPCGRGNDLARVLGIPAAVEAAAEVLAAGRVRRIDLGRIGDHRFSTVASLGFDAEAAELVHRRRVPFTGTAAYLCAVARTLVTYRAPGAHLEGSFGVFDGEILLAATGNTSTYGGGMRIAPRAVCDDGLLDLCIVRPVPRATFLRHFPRIFAGTHENLPFVEMLRTRELAITTSRPLWIYADGEPIGRTPARITVEPGALAVRCPAWRARPAARPGRGRTAGPPPQAPSGAR
jgi:diacylglycerol kinase (ATP)